MSWQNFPMIICPHCKKEFQLDDYYDYKSGDSFICHYCDKDIYIWAMYITLSADIQPKPNELAED